MSTDKFENISLNELSLEPLPDPNLLNYQPPKAGGKATFQTDARVKSTSDRRQNDSDRRNVLRFESDRRSGKERRPKKSWEPGKNL
ncbi:MAG: hypothetical protein ABI588_09105 [Arenimonas sp.]